MASLEARHSFELVILDYMAKRGFHETSEVSARETIANPNLVAINAPEGFLLEWWNMSDQILSSRFPKVAQTMENIVPNINPENSTYVPNLKVLSVRCTVLPKPALIITLDGLKKLEVLNISHCLITEVSPPAPEKILTKLDESILEKESRLRKFITCMSDSCIMCQRTRYDEGLMRWYKYEEYLWKEDETAVDGQRSAVAPLKRCSGKPLIKVRDHQFLKKNQPPHFTVLCLVRDAAARLPGGVGTRADICVLVRDSQFIVEDISDLQVSQVVSGALDRLHYENDPFIQQFLRVTHVNRFSSSKGRVRDIRSICWDMSGNYLASVSKDGARIWSISDGLYMNCIPVAIVPVMHVPPKASSILGDWFL
ncbi:hypothetical protein K7X08_035929 [Anisodus acutangulus]|uniref:Nuclear factor related to kappa-B-binding protein second winged helix domain-containing protein n=1 Tax=Anisodus acutangulus TaxID=402998 RepID=A0A9Q1L8K5_9SOLA|nr:hypothetical protein K7X08_035929 [Anisodus acutangulus]